MTEKESVRPGLTENVIAFATQNPRFTDADLHKQIDLQQRRDDSPIQQQQCASEIEEIQREIREFLQALIVTIGVPLLLPCLIAVTLLMNTNIVVCVVLVACAGCGIWPLHQYRQVRREQREDEQARRDAYLDGVWEQIAQGKGVPSPPNLPT